MATFTRKSSRDMSPEEWVLFKRAWDRLNETGRINYYAQVHADMAEHTMAGMVHGIPGPRGNNLLFLFWHAQILKALEEELNQAIPGAILPYWDALAEPAGPPALSDYAPAVRRTGAGTWPLSRRFSQTRLNPPGLPSGPDFAEFSRVLESGYHNAVHVYVGGSMNNMATAAGDPLFYMHHCYIDYLWVQWRLNQDAPSNMPPSSTLLRPWNVSCEDVYNSNGYRYYAVGAAAPSGQVATPRLVGDSKRSSPPVEMKIEVISPVGMPLAMPLLRTTSSSAGTVEEVAPSTSTYPNGLPMYDSAGRKLCHCGREFNHPRKYT